MCDTFYSIYIISLFSTAVTKLFEWKWKFNSRILFSQVLQQLNEVDTQFFDDLLQVSEQTADFATKT